MTPLYLTVAQVAVTIAASERFVLDELRRKNLRGSKTPAGWRVKPSDLERYMDARANLAKIRGAAS